MICNTLITGSNPVVAFEESQKCGSFFDRKMNLLNQKNLRACVLRGKELWLLVQPRSGARVRLPGLFVLIKANKISEW